MYLKYHSTRKAMQVTRSRAIPMRLRPVAYPLTSQPSAFHFICLPSISDMTRYLQDKSPLVRGLARIIQHMTYVAVDDLRPGVTWPELYLLSLLATGLSTSQLDPPNAKVKPNIHRRLHSFKRDAGHLFRFMLTTDQQQHFKASKCPPYRLRTYGYTRTHGHRHARVAHISHTGQHTGRKHIHTRTRTTRTHTHISTSHH